MLERRLAWPVQAGVVLLVVAVMVAACGGGGGNDTSRPQTTAPTCVQTVEGCLTQAQYEARLREIEDTHNGEDDFKNQWGLTAIRADRAYAQLELERGIGTAPGSGQTVGVIDTGIDTGHQAFAGKTVTEHFFSGAEDEDGSERSHGTGVAGVIVGRPSAAFTRSVTAGRGVAWGADIAMFAVPTGSSDTYRPISLTSLGVADDRWAPRFTHVIDWSRNGRTIDFVNLSINFNGIIEQYSAQQLRANFGDAIDALAQDGTGDDTVFVWAAGNAHGDPCDPADFTNNPDLCEAYVDSNNQTRYRVNAKSVEILAGLPVRIPELRDRVVAVVAVGPDSDGDGDHEIASFSNRCGIAARWCIAAPGVRIRAAYFGPHPDDNSPGSRGAYNANGTSFAAPMVTGALVVMKHHFRDEIPNTGLISRLLATAYDEGIYANGAVYGHGLLDLAAALSPQGTPRVSLSARVDGIGANLTQTRFALGNAFGDGLTRALAGQEIAAFDSLGAPFWYALGSFTGTAGGPSMTARLRGFMAPSALESVAWRPVLGAVESHDRVAGDAPLPLGLLDAPAQGTRGGHLSVAGRALALNAAEHDGFSAAAFSTEGLDGRAPTSGATLSWRPEGAPLGLRGGFVGEREALLGTRAAGAFGRISSGAAFAGIEGQARLGAWRLGAGAEVGTVNAEVHGGLIADFSPLTTSAFAVEAARELTDAGTLTLALSQPLRVETGHASLSVPVGRTRDGQVRRRSVEADLAPSGRQIELAAEWRQRLDGGGDLRLGAAWTHDPGHIAAVDPDLSFLAGWRRAF